VVESAVAANSLFGWSTAEIVFTANTAAKVKTTADAAMVIVFM
jgi:hypothetical protein